MNIVTMNNGGDEHSEDEYPDGHIRAEAAEGCLSASDTKIEIMSYLYCDIL